MRRRRDPTFAEIVAAERDRPPGPPDVRPGRFNAHGRLSDPQGRPVERTEDDVEPERAAQLVAEGAQVAFECCGCGGGVCGIEWLPVSSSLGVPDLSTRRPEGAFIDVWVGPGDVRVVFLHGDVRWPGVVP